MAILQQCEPARDCARSCIKELAVVRRERRIFGPCPRACGILRLGTSKHLADSTIPRRALSLAVASDQQRRAAGMSAVLHTRKSHRRDRTGWLGWEDSCLLAPHPLQVRPRRNQLQPLLVTMTDGALLHAWGLSSTCCAAPHAVRAWRGALLYLQVWEFSDEASIFAVLRPKLLDGRGRGRSLPRCRPPPTPQSSRASSTARSEMRDQPAARSRNAM